MFPTNTAVTFTSTNNINNELSPPPECQFFEFFGKKVAYFIIDNQKMACLLQIYDLFLKQLVGGLHTIYTKLKRLKINPIVCTVDQVRILRLVGAIQNGVNRCKLIEMSDLERLIDDCSDIRPRPGRPPRRTITTLIPKPDQGLSTAILPISGLTKGQLPSTSISTDTLANPLQFLTSFLPIPQTALTPEVFASVIQQHRPNSICEPQQQHIQVGNKSINTNLNQRNNDSEDKEFESDNSANENSNNEYEKSESSSAKPSGNNSETDDSFDREKSMSATDQDSGSGSGSGPSSSQGDSSPNSQSIQFLLNKLICLIETTESAFKSHCQRLTELSSELHKQIHEIVHRERSAQLSLYFQRQKAAHYQRRYIAKKFAPYRHKKRHHHKLSPKWNNSDNND